MLKSEDVFTMKYDDDYAKYITDNFTDDLLECMEENEDIISLSDRITKAVYQYVDNDFIYDHLEQFVSSTDEEEIIRYMGIKHCLSKYKYISLTKMCMDVLADELTCNAIRNSVCSRITPRAIRRFISCDIADLKYDMCSVYICEKCPAKKDGVCVLQKLQDDVNE